MPERHWTIRVCRKCGDHHGTSHDGCVTYRHPLFPQDTEHAGVDEVEVIPAVVTDEMVERAAISLDTGGDRWHWSTTDAERDEWRRDARAALNAALGIVEAPDA